MLFIYNHPTADLSPGNQPESRFRTEKVRIPYGFQIQSASPIKYTVYEKVGDRNEIPWFFHSFLLIQMKEPWVSCPFQKSVFPIFFPETKGLSNLKRQKHGF